MNPYTISVLESSVTQPSTLNHDLDSENTTPTIPGLIYNDTLWHSWQMFRKHSASLPENPCSSLWSELTLSFYRYISSLSSSSFLLEESATPLSSFLFAPHTINRSLNHLLFLYISWHTPSITEWSRVLTRNGLPLPLFHEQNSS